MFLLSIGKISPCHLLILLETEQLAEDMFWHVHCKLFQRDAEKQLKHLGAIISASVAKLMSAGTSKQPAYMRVCNHWMFRPYSYFNSTIRMHWDEP